MTAVLAHTRASTSLSPNLDRLRTFTARFAALMDQRPDEAGVFADGGALLADLVAHDDWLPQACAQPDPERYRQYLLHCDSADRFSVVSFVWGPGQATPVHDHTVWGMVGVLRGAEVSTPFSVRADGRLAPRRPQRLETGAVERLSPSAGDIHQVANAFADRVSISIHVYGGDIGAIRRSVFSGDGRRKPFISGYSNPVPNVWDALANQRPNP